MSIAAAASRARTILAGGTAVTLGSVVLMNVMRIFSTVVLTRLLSEEAFGIVGVIASVSFMLIMLADVGLFAFTVRHAEGDDERFLDEVWTIRIIRSFVLMIAMAAAAWPVAAFTRQPEMFAVLLVWSTTFLIEGLSSMSFATAVRRNQLRLLAGFDLTVLLFQIVSSIILALIFRNYWALVGGGIVVAMFKAGLSYIFFANNGRRWRLSKARAKELWRFSRAIASSSALGMLIAQADKLVFARIMPLATFGLYTIATSLAIAPTMLSVPFAERIVYPGVASDVRDGKNLRESFYRRRRNVVWLYAFLVGGFIGSAPLLVELLYDPRYRGVATFVQILSISSLAAIFSATSQQALFAIEQTAWAFRATATRAVWLSVGCVLAFVREDSLLLVWTVGLMEVPGMLVYWLGLQRNRIFNSLAEAPPFAIAGVGYLIGVLGSWPILDFLAQVQP